MSDSPDAVSPAAQPLHGKRVLITGGASGIGRAAAMTLAGYGARVLAVDVDDAAGRHLIDKAGRMGRDVSFVHADISLEFETAAAVDTAATDLGGIDVLIHAAGIMSGQLEDIRDFGEATWDRVIDVNLKGAFFVAKHVAKVMVPAGVIILVASKAGVTTGSGSYAYGASKGGVHGLTLTLDRHLAPHGIRVNDLCPGEIDTPLMRASLAEAASHGGDTVAIEQTLRRLTTPEAVADVLAFLASDAAACVRGTIFTS